MAAEDRGCRHPLGGFPPRGRHAGPGRLCRQRWQNEPRLVAVGYASNALGTINPVAKIVEMAHAAGALVYIDAVQYAPHGPIDVQELGCDFLVCSSYKFFGPHIGRALRALRAAGRADGLQGAPGAQRPAGQVRDRHAELRGHGRACWGRWNTWNGSGRPLAQSYAEKYAGRYNGRRLRLKQAHGRHPRLRISSSAAAAGCAGGDPGVTDLRPDRPRAAWKSACRPSPSP